MKLSAILEPLIAAGVSGDIILATVKAFEEQQQNEIEKRRASDRERQRRHRHVMSRDVTVTERDMVSPKKEIPPTPPKEKTTPSSVSEPVGSSTGCPEPEKSAPVSRVSSVIDLPATQGQSVAITDGDVAEWSAAYPAVDVLQQLRSMRQWLLANDRNRKTVRGMRKFVVSWLARAQDRGPRLPQAPPLGRETEFARHQRECTEALERRVLGEKRNDDFASNGPAFDLEPRDWHPH